MIRYFIIIFFLINISVPGQDNLLTTHPEIISEHIIKYLNSDSADNENPICNRGDRLLYIFGGLDGFGAGISLFERLDLQISGFLTFELFKTKIFLFDDNSSPYIGLNIGKERSLNFGGGGKSNEWTAVLVGWQFYPFDNRGFFEFALQYPIWELNKDSFQPTLISFTAGLRLF